MQTVSIQQLSILFLCTGNACRSQMAEGWARELFARSPLAKQLKVNIYSAGVEAHGVNPKAIESMAAVGIDISNQSSDVLDPGMLDGLDYLITLCGSAADRCPAVPSSATHLHWDLQDPALAEHNQAETFARVRNTIKGHVTELVYSLEQGYQSEDLLDDFAAELSAPTYTVEQVQVLARDVKYKGFYQLDQYTLKHKLFAGGWSKPFSRELFERGHSVVVLPFDAKRDELVLVEQFRIGALDDERSPWLVECIAGMVDEGETPEQVARREAMEEAGCEVGVLVPIACYWPSPGGSNEKVHLFCGKTNSEGLGGVHGLEYENEDIRVHLVSSQLASKLLEEGVINNAAAIIAIQWLQLNRESLVRQWG